MTPTQTVKQYGELAVAQSRRPPSSCRAPRSWPSSAPVTSPSSAPRPSSTQFRSRAEALPGEAQVQADLAVKEARTRATEAAGTARAAAQQLAAAVRPEALRSTVAGLVETARTQAAATVEKLAEHGAEVVEELRQPARLPPGRAPRRDAPSTPSRARSRASLEETAKAVADASNKVTSVAQKTAARATKVARQGRDQGRRRRQDRPRRPPRRPSRPRPRQAAPKAPTHAGQEDHARPPARPPGQGDLGPRDPRPHRQAGRPDRGARQEELTPPVPLPRAPELRSRAPGPCAVPGRSAGRISRRRRRVRCATWGRSTGSSSRSCTGRSSALAGWALVDALIRPATGLRRGRQADQARLGRDHRRWRLVIAYFDRRRSSFLRVRLRGGRPSTRPAAVAVYLGRRAAPRAAGRRGTAAGAAGDHERQRSPWRQP